MSLHICYKEAINVSKVLFIDPEKCNGCRACEWACSLYTENVVNKSRIHIVKWLDRGVEVPMMCVQCEIALCEKICPVKAIERNEDTGAMVVDYDKCIGCKLCTYVCPFGGIYFDTEKRRVIKCELCGGDPVCVKVCDTEAIQYVEATRANMLKKRAAIKKIPELLQIAFSPTT